MADRLQGIGVPTFGKTSKSEMATCHVRLQKALEEAIKIVDFKVLQGHRTQEEQDRLFREGRSKVRWPQGKHNTIPSLAVDVAPYPIDWDSKHATKKFAFLAGVLTGIAHLHGVRLRWGGDWDGDGQMRDQSFHDLPHLELAVAPDEE